MNITPLANEQEIDGCVAHFQQTALLASELYRAFSGAGLPPDLVADMVRDWHLEAIRSKTPDWEEE